MPISGRIDLHMHSTVSDGTDSPLQLLSRVSGAGYSLFSLTDHDATKGCVEIIDALEPGSPSFITGVEISCRDAEGKYHILGYGYDPDAETINRLVGRAHLIRFEKLQLRIDRLKEMFGFVFPKEEVDALYKLDNPGKPHIGDLMVRHGYAKSIGDAIKDYINKLGVRSENIAPQTAIDMITASGGIPVLAHPFFGDGDQLIIGEEMEQRLARLKDMGIRGVEAFYSGFAPRMIANMLEMADRYGLYVTAGSDYHGSIKLVRLGDTNLEDVADAPDGLKKFLSDIADRTFSVV
ncbi:MAG: PHP domain-containing protein [Oscillospiraceae bacterium]|nr:PHP domain-containing protein [Oscillospiraceae bacterium]